MIKLPDDINNIYKVRSLVLLIFLIIGISIGILISYWDLQIPLLLIFTISWFILISKLLQKRIHFQESIIFFSPILLVGWDIGVMYLQFAYLFIFASILLLPKTLVDSCNNRIVNKYIAIGLLLIIESLLGNFVTQFGVMGFKKVFQQGLLFYVFWFISRFYYSYNEQRNKYLRILTLVTLVIIFYSSIQVVAQLIGKPLPVIWTNYFTYPPEMLSQLTNWVVDIGGNVLPRVNGTFNDPSILGGYLLSTLPLILVEIKERKGKLTNTKILVVSALGVILLIYTFSRSVWIGACGEAALLLLIYLKYRTNFFKKTILLAGLIISIIIFASTKVASDISQRMLQTFDIDNISTAGHYLYAMKSLEAFYSSPLVGIGWGNFSSFLGYYGMTHSAPLSVLSQQGIIGLILWLIIFVMLVRDSIVSLKRNPIDLHLQAWWVGLIGLFLANIGYDYTNQLYVWVYLGIGMILLSGNTTEDNI